MLCSKVLQNVIEYGVYIVDWVCCICTCRLACCGACCALAYCRTAAIVDVEQVCGDKVVICWKIYIWQVCTACVGMLVLTFINITQ